MPTMNIPTHILDAVQTSDFASHSRLDTGSFKAGMSPNLSPRVLGKYNSSAEDVSSMSDSENDREYQTDFTTPAGSDSHSAIDDSQPDDVESFRDREYPQLKGKTYLDHGGTTVCIFQQHVDMRV